ncbi:MAG: TIGR02266 family protein [Archangium sp.]
MSNENRSNQRKAVGLLVKLAHKGLDEFASKYATNLSDGGMFIRTREPKAIGTELNFKVEIASGQRVLQGTAIVRWVRGENDPGGPAGMGLQFVTLDPASRELVDRMLASTRTPEQRAAEEIAALSGGGAPIAPAVAPAIAPAIPTGTQGGVRSPLAPAIPTGTQGGVKSPLAAPPAIPTGSQGGVKSPLAPIPTGSQAGVKSPLAPPPAIPTGTQGGVKSPLAPPAPIPTGSQGGVKSPLAPPPAIPTGTQGGVKSPLAPPPPAIPTGTQGGVKSPLAPPARPGAIPMGSQAGVKSPLAPPPPAPPPPAAVEIEDEPFSLAAEVEKSAAPEAADDDVALDSGFELDVDTSDVFTATANTDTRNAIELDLDSLLSGAPPPADVPISSSDSGVAIDLEPLEQAEALPPLPELRREAPPPPPPPAAPQVLQRVPEAPPPPPPQPQTAAQPAGPVYLKDVKVGGDATGALIGIDLGTTNSACAVLNKGRPQILVSRDGYNTIPSIVALTAQGKLLLGHRARSQMVLNPTQSIFGAKRLVGRDFDSPTVKQVKEHAHFEIVQGADRRAAVKLGDKTLSLDEVQALVLKECRDMAEQTLGTPVTRAVVTCPAYYSEPQREAVRRAGAMAGLKVERVLNEPTAAALAFGMNREMSKTIMVYDLGGGTFDATILKIDQNVFEVMATGGDVFLGGTDFDSQVTNLLLERYAAWHKRPFAGDRVALSRIAEVAEKTKIALSERTTFDVHLPMLEMDSSGKPLDLRTTVTRAELDAACSELVDRTIQAVQDVLLDAKLKASQIDDIILVGGQSRMPLVREKLKELFKKPAHASVNADEAVALGAALYSGTVDKVSSLVLIDVVPMTIGLGRPGGAFHRLIERNTPLPVTKSFGISTQKDNETELEVMVFQGEDSNVAGNEFLGAVQIAGLPKGPAGSVQVAVTLSLDAECVLRVEAREFKTRTVVRSTLATRYTTDEIASRLGITAEKAAQVNKSREEELEKRAGGFWGKLKGLFSRKK